MTEKLTSTLATLASKTSSVSMERQAVLEPLVEYVLDRQRANETTRLNFICTHNARRSHISQLMAAASAMANDLENIECYSGGVEVTRIHPNAIGALEELGFEFNGSDDGDNPVFLVDLGEANLIEVFSKKYDDDSNPPSDFAAVMVCSSAEEACPYVEGASKRISVTFEDPKEFDGQDDAVKGYVQGSLEIGAEIYYVMQQVSSRLEA